jgi:hypothetical protein
MPPEIIDDTIPIEEAIMLSYNSMKEKEFQSMVEEIAKLYGWTYYHTYNSRRSEPGFPDLVMLRGEREVVAELKSQKGKLTEPQKDWLKKFKKAGNETFVWRPSDIRDIEEILS